MMRTFEPPHQCVIHNVPLRSSWSRDLESAVEEVHRCSPDQCMQMMAIDSGCVDTGFREFVPPLLIAFVREDLMVDAARQNLDLSVWDVFAREYRVVGWRCLSIALANDQIGGSLHGTEPFRVHAEEFHDPRRHRKSCLHAGVVNMQGRRWVDPHLSPYVAGNLKLKRGDRIGKHHLHLLWTRTRPGSYGRTAGVSIGIPPARDIK
jgi:hypothetical protein